MTQLLSTKELNAFNQLFELHTKVSNIQQFAIVPPCFIGSLQADSNAIDTFSQYEPYNNENNTLVEYFVTKKGSSESISKLYPSDKLPELIRQMISDVDLTDVSDEPYQPKGPFKFVYPVGVHAVMHADSFDDAERALEFERYSADDLELGEPRIYDVNGVEIDESDVPESSESDDEEDED